MINLCKKNFNQYKDLIISLYKESNNINGILPKLLENGIKSSKTSIHRLFKEFNLIAEYDLTKKISNNFLVKELLQNVLCEEKTIEEVRDLINKELNFDYNIFDTHSTLRRLNLTYKKKDLNKKCYINSKRVISKYKYCFDFIQNIINLSNLEILTQLKQNGIKDPAGNDFNIFQVYHIKNFLKKENAPRGEKEIRELVEKYNYRLLSLIDLKENDLSVKGKFLNLVCSKDHQRNIALTRFLYSLECPECIKQDKLESHNIKVSGYFDNYNFQYLGRGVRNSEFLAKCLEGHEFSVLLSNFKKNNTCPICYHERNGYSLSEKAIVQHIKSIYSGCILENNREIIPPKELDIFIPEKNLAIEYSGLYFHSLLVKGLKEAKITHREKYERCLEKSIKLITIFEDEWIYNENICKSRIENVLGLSKKIYARKLKNKIIDEKLAKEFLDKTHLQGYSQSKIAFGLIDKSENIISVLTLGDITRQSIMYNIEAIEIKRFASILGYNILGSFSELLKQAVIWAKTQGYKIIRIHCDLRWENSNLYEKNNFKLIYESKFTPHYFKRLDRYINMTLKKTKEERKSNQTELELRVAQGFNVIYDCGYSIWELNI